MSAETKLELFEVWGDIDRSHRKLAHQRRPFSEWAEYRKNSIWIYDCTRFHGCPHHAVFAVMDLVTRKWISALVSIEETSTQVQVAFMDALEVEGLLEVIEARQDTVPADTFLVAWRRFDELPSQPLPWLYGVARNVGLRYRSALARQEVMRRALESEPGFTRAEGDDPVLWEAWNQLSDRDREVLALVAWEELPIGDAARALRCSPATFSFRLHRARRRLERRLQQPRSLSDSTPALSEVT